MIRFAAGISIIILALIMGTYKYMEHTSDFETRSAALEDALSKRDAGKDLARRIVTIRKMGLEMKEIQKVNLERMLDIGAPRMELKIVGQPLIRGANKALGRYVFRITGPATFAETNALLARMTQLRGFVPYRYCFACSAPPRGTPDGYSMVNIEGYIYGFDTDTLY